jgi:diguanylate cyclase (GGDEF)-like protein/PAS domain S-box-containing protein
VVAFVGVQNDITDLKERERLRGERYFKALVEHISDMIAVVTPDGIIQYISDAALPTIGCRPESLVRTSIFERLAANDTEDVTDAIASCARHAGQSAPIDALCRHADGSWRYLEIVATNRLDDPWVKGIVLNCRDVIERRRYVEQLRHKALHDSLTGLPNRALLEDRLQQAKALVRKSGSSLAMLIVGLDRFKDISDALGHHAGDRLLAELSSRIRKVAHPADTVARFAGDEFALVIPGASANAVQLARDVLAALSEPVCLDGSDVHTEATVGIAIFPEDGVDAASLMSHADAAMYTAKRTGNSFAVYSARDGQHSMGRLTLMSELRQSIARGDLVLHFQPKVDLRTARVVSAEALVRWRHPTRGLLYLDEFISIAEETGLIESLTLAVLDDALQECSYWQQHGDSLSIAVNVSAPSLQHLEFTDQILACIRRHDVPGKSIILEV